MQPSPGLLSFDFGNRLSTHTILCCKNALNLCSSSNRLNLISSQFGSSMPLSSSNSFVTNPIRCILHMRSQLQMIRIHTLPPTCMTDDKTVWYLAVCQFPCNAMRCCRCICGSKFAIPTSIFSCYPLPTLIVSAAANLAPESLIH